MKHLSFILLVIFTTETSLGCSTFYLDNSHQPVMAKSYDWWYGSGAMTINKRKMNKWSIPPSKNDVSIEWKSKYASITFNQYGHELPNGGMNEQGLAVEILWLNETKYPSSSKYFLNELQIIQYILDNFSNVEETLRGLEDINVKPLQANVHYFMCDAGGTCAVMEFLNGQKKIYTGANLPIKAITNDSYENSLAHAKKYKLFGGSKEFPKKTNSKSLDRFMGSARAAKEFNRGDSPVSYAQLNLDRVAGKSDNQWKVVYDLNNKQVYFSPKKSIRFKFTDLDNFDLDCNNGNAKVIDLQSSYWGEVTNHFQDFTKGFNEYMVLKVAFGFPKELIKLVLGYPESTSCKQQIRLK